jgi:hypothetical protein
LSQGLVQAEALRPRGGRLRPLYGDGIERGFEELVVVAVGSVVGQADGDPGAFGEDRALRPFLALSVGLGPVFPAPRGALVMAPSQERKSQSMPTTSSSSSSPSRQSSWNTPARCHSSEAAVGRGARADAGGGKRVPLHAAAQHQEDGVHGASVRHPGAVAAQRVRGRGGRRGSIFTHSQSGIRQPSSRSTSPMVAPLIGGQTAGRPTDWVAGVLLR